MISMLWRSLNFVCSCSRRRGCSRFAPRSRSPLCTTSVRTTPPLASPTPAQPRLPRAVLLPLLARARALHPFMSPLHELVLESLQARHCTRTPLPFPHARCRLRSPLVPPLIAGDDAVSYSVE
ncbi:hypothetical protein VPH35_091217 [Triticum aestivum]